MNASAPVRKRVRTPGQLLPGILLCLAVGAAAELAGAIEAAVFSRAWLEPLVLAILLGMVIGNAVDIPKAVKPGIRFSAKSVLDVAVALLGATLSLAALESLGGTTVLLIALMVFVALAGAFLLGRALGLGARLAMLIAAGNAICGNSAIAAVAPIIGADEEEVAAAISLTALLGVFTVLALPIAVYIFGLALPRYAVLTGLTVYAVPQVIAAAAPFGTATVTLATFVKLARVLMLGPLTLALSLLAPRFDGTAQRPPDGRSQPTLFLPWFIVAFLLLAACRWTGLLSDQVAGWLGTLSNYLAVVAMAALGFGVRLRSLFEVGPRVALGTALANVLMLVLAIGMLHIL
ncbi:putative sulfate exporter family transporter [Sphingomonas sp. BN140010]|uniref:Sulfate exporter family transporter n=1 Tax=Sphingomonas arvum TaxID=2992113 RepID=A0ABT3JEZ4_9SPHN|nr:putative sulfate exporter family transporter [Sphingomonas sp. BN140010]MCW3797579.1 putative sulfate exporter family transporter [Sphingomonas sp. BN140010]